MWIHMQGIYSQMWSKQARVRQNMGIAQARQMSKPETDVGQMTVNIIQRVKLTGNPTDRL